MKKIISNPQIICPVCGCEFEYDKEDIIKIEYELRTADPILTIVCPVCGKEIHTKN